LDCGNPGEEKVSLEAEILPLALRECDGLFPNCVRPGKTVAVTIENRGKPMAVLLAFVFPNFVRFVNFN
jgi:hypothetical protein